MRCSTIIKNDSYDFFDSINEYIKHSNESESDNSQLDTGDDCNSFSEMYANGNNTVWKNICEQFIKLCKQLPRIKNSNENEPNYIKDWNFLSYWLNIKLRENQLYGNTCPNSFYSKMEHHCIKTLPFSSSTNFIYNINEEDLSRMELLYILHDNYSKLDTIINNNTPPNPESLLKHSSTCSVNYNNAKYMCNDNYKKFCEKLDNYKKKYEELFRKAESKGDKYTNNFKKLTDYDNSNIISTTLIGSAVGLIPLLGILYKFTPLGQMFKSQKRYLPKGHSNNIDEIMKTSFLNYENEQINLNQDKYNIEYHPTRVL